MTEALIRTSTQE